MMATSSRAMRATITMVMVLTLAALLAACGSEAAPQTGGATAPAQSSGGGATEAESSGSTIKIGAIYPLSGPQAQTGNDLKAALDLAVEIINNKYPDLPFTLAASEGLPNLDGVQIEVLYGDSQAKAELGQSEAERLMGQQVVALYGCYNSAVTKTASSVAERNGLPFVNGSSSSPDLTERGYRWFFRTSPTDTDFSKVMFQFLTDLKEENGAEFNGVALLYEDTDFGVNSAKTQKQFAEETGIAVLGEVKYRSRSSTLTSEIQQLEASGADILLPSSYVNDAILTVKTAQELGYAPKLILAQDAGYLDNAFLEATGDNANGIASRAAFNADLTAVKDLAATIDTMYQERHGRPLTDAPARVFTGFMALAEAINRAGSTDPEAIRQQLIATNIPADQLIMPWKGIKFDAKGQNELGQAIVIQMQDGKYVTVYPFEFATAQVIYPGTAWGQ